MGTGNDQQNQTGIIMTRETILQEVATAFGVAPESIKSKKRDRQIRWARWMYWAVLRDKGFMLTECARETGHDHSSVQHAMGKLYDEVQSNKKLQAHHQAINIQFTLIKYR